MIISVILKYIAKLARTVTFKWSITSHREFVCTQWAYIQFFIEHVPKNTADFVSIISYVPSHSETNTTIVIPPTLGLNHITHLKVIQ